ncbi:sporulation protein [Hazenella sp. IB182353]|uniref:sporulation protein n=1 Tax=Polycladospora coralii TaxID=2771432 RepID=UPI00174704AA|nr:sporulation protein [Polycladospora coralii]MBS7531029.1 sporulation protein [Polycladospora coralii]
MVFRKVLAKLGKGAAQVDLVLSKPEISLGEQLEGELVIQGGTITQEINKIDVDFMIQIQNDEHQHTELVHRIPLHTAFTIQAGEHKTCPFSFDIPENLLLSGAYISYYFKTRLDIADGVDSLDHDAIQILAPARLKHVFIALEKLGFREKVDSRSIEDGMQEFEFGPLAPRPDGVKEVEFYAVLEDDGIMLFMEVEKVDGFIEQEFKQNVWIDNEMLMDIDQLVVFMENLLQSNGHFVNPSVFQKKDFYHRYFSGSKGAVGAFIAGVLAAEIFEDVIEDAFEELMEEEEDEEVDEEL